MGSWRLTVIGALGFVALGTASAAAIWRPLPAPAQGKMPVAVENRRDGRIRVQRAGRKAVLDLSREISGCEGPLYDSTDNGRIVQADVEGGVGLEIVDETEKAPYIYVILLASASPNCNVQGRCGAGGPDLTLLWLKLTRDLKLAGKQDFTIEDCLADRSVTLAAAQGQDQADQPPLRAKDLPWVGDKLQVDFEEGAEAVKHRLVYDRRNPEAGLQQAP